MSASVRPHNVTLTDEAWEHLVKQHGARGAAAALENAYRASVGMPPRPNVQERGRFTKAPEKPTQ